MIQRGEIWWADLDEPRGSRPGGRRPVLVLSANSFNRSAIRTVICVVVTSNRRLADAPGNVMLSRGTGGLGRASVANVSQLITLDKDDLIERVGRLGASEMRLVEAGIRRVLDLGAGGAR